MSDEPRLPLFGLPVPGLLVALATLLGLSFLLPASRTAPPPETKAESYAGGSSQNQETKESTPSLNTPLWDYLGIDEDSRRAPAACERREQSQPVDKSRISVPTSITKWLDPALMQLDFLIACVPDPVDSSIGYKFDLAVDALQQALSSEGYLLDRYYLPWSAASQGKTPLPHKEEPGLLLFRWKIDEFRDREWLLLVYLVGETPVAGINKHAFWAAVEHGMLLRSFHGNQTDYHVRVLGPCYTGSAESLASALDDCWQGWPSFVVISGSASGIARDTFENVPFHSTVVHSDIVSDVLFRFVAERQWPVVMERPRASPG